MSSALVSRHITTRWYAAGILTTAVVGLGLVAPRDVTRPLVRAISARPT